MAFIEIDGTRHEVRDGDSLLAACLSLGLDLPYFCWHPAMGSVGACRQCAVIQLQNPEDTRGRLIMACMTPVVDGMRIAIEAPAARQFRDEIIELLMTNHPHDCPVCEEGGECHLQDMTVMTGHTFRRYRGLKRTHRNQYLGPFINHEMNRCIACYRCVRFYQDYAGGSDLQALGVHHNVYFGRHEDGVLENEFSGNLVEVCPTGVFTDKTFSDHYTRKWDLQTAPSVCVHCGVGCNTTPGERYGELRRIVNRYNGEVNGYFLCDRGRFGHGFVNSERRVRQPMTEGLTTITPQTAERRLRAVLKDTRVVGIGSPRASLEANFALRTLVGEDNFFLGLSETEHTVLETILDILRNGGIVTPSLREVEEADAVLVLGEDVTHSAPRLALSLRQAVRNASFRMAERFRIPAWQADAVRELAQDLKSPLHIASLCASRLDDVAAATYRGAPEDIARLGCAVARELDGAAPDVPGLGEEEARLAAAIAEDLKQAQRPLVVAGASCQTPAVVQAAFNVAKALGVDRARLAFTVPECNSLGLAMMGGRRLAEAFAAAGEGGATVVVLENDLYRRAPRDAVDRFLESAAHVVAVDSLIHDTAKKAALILPAATFAEDEGTLISGEGRAQRFFAVYAPRDAVRASWRWLLPALRTTHWRHIDDVMEACAEAFPHLASIRDAAPKAHFRIKGMKIPRQPHRYSGRTAMLADISVSEPKQPEDTESPFAFSMEGASAGVPPALLPNVWAPGWDSNQSVSKFQDEVAGHLRGGDGGVRLIEAAGTRPWFDPVPEAFTAQPERWRAVPLQHIFGSEELSVNAAPLTERIAAPHAVLNPADAEGLSLASGEAVMLKGPDGTVIARLPVVADGTLPRGLIGIPGVPGCPRFFAAETVALEKAPLEAPEGEGS